MDDQETELPPPRVLIFPYPAQGHVNPMLKLAELLCHTGLHVTFLVTHFTHRPLLRNSIALISWLTRYSGFRFEAIPEGLPEDNLRSGESHGAVSFVQSYDKTTSQRTARIRWRKGFGLGSKVGILHHSHGILSSHKFDLVIFGDF